MAAESKKTRTLAMELRQILQADHMAVDLINNARATRDSIEKRTAEERDKILQDAKTQMAEMTRQVEEEHQNALATRKAEAEKAFANQRAAIDSEMQRSHDAWVKELTSSIIGR